MIIFDQDSQKCIVKILYAMFDQAIFKIKQRRILYYMPFCADSKS